jgi:hypothetical protein
MWPSLKLRFRFGTSFDSDGVGFAKKNFSGGHPQRSGFAINGFNPEALSAFVPYLQRPRRIVPPTARWPPLWPKSCLSKRNELCSPHLDHLSGAGESCSLRGGW